MIDHYVSIGDEDVSSDCYAIRISQTMTTDSDPGKATIDLVNRRQKYTDHWPPQATPFTVYFSNYTYKNEPKIFYGLAGHVTDVKCTAEEAVVTGECGMGHLADALGKEYYFSSDHPPDGVTGSAISLSAAAISNIGVSSVPGGSLAQAVQTQAIQSNLTSTSGGGGCNTRDILIKILSDHQPNPIKVNYTAEVLELSEQAYSAESNYQYVVNDIAQKVGAVFYFIDHDTLEFHAPEQWTGIYDLDGYMTNPEQTASIMGYCNIVEVVGYEAYENGTGPGSRMASAERIYANARDEDSIARYGELRAPAYYSLDITTQEAAEKKATELLAFFKLHENALTKPIVAGMAPPLQSRVSYTPFIPIYGGSGSFGQVQGVVVEREIEYDADQGLVCTLTLAPSLVDDGLVITGTEIDTDYTTSYTEDDEE